MNYALVGAFVVVLAAALIAALLWVAAGGGAQRKVDLYLAIEEESVSGLNVNAPVKFNGVEVGSVREIDLDPADPDRVRLLFAIRQGTPVKADTVAMLKTQGLTGIAYVELAGGTPGSPPLVAAAGATYPVIRTKPSLSARLENVLSTVLVKLDATTTRIDALLSLQNQQALSSTLADIAALAHTLAARRGSMDATLLSAARTFDQTDRLGRQLGAQLGPVIERVGRAADAVRQLGSEGAQASMRAGAAATAIGAEVHGLGVRTLPEVDRLLAELQALSASLRRLTEQTERNPSGLLLGRTAVPDGPGESTPAVAAP